MEPLVKISEIIARRHELKRQMDGLDVELEHAIASMPSSAVNADLLSKMTDEVRELQDKIKNQRTEIDSMRRSIKEVSDELDSGESDCGGLIQLIEELQSSNRAPAWSSDPDSDEE